MKLYAATSSTNPLDVFVGKDLWVKVIISGDDPWFYRGGYIGGDKLFYINIVDVDLDHDRYEVHCCTAAYLDPDGYFYGELHEDEILWTKDISRSLTLLFKPVTVLSDEEVWDTVEEYHDEEDEE